MRGIITAAALALSLSAVPGSAAGTVVLFDEGHGQAFLTGRDGELDLSGLATLLREAGMEVRTGRGRLDARALRGVGALVISGPFVPLSPEEVEAVRAFVAHGGRLALMLHVAQPLQGLLEQLGLQYSRGPVHEAEGIIEGRDLDLTVTRFRPHPVTDGLGGLSVFGCWALKNHNPGAVEIARTGEKSWLDSDGNGRLSPGEPVGEQAIVVAGALAEGDYIVFGDDAIFQNRFLQAYNRDLGRRLARWLAAAPAQKTSPPQRPGGAKL